MKQLAALLHLTKHKTAVKTQSHPTSTQLTLPYLTLPYPTLPYPTLPYPTLPYLFTQLAATGFMSNRGRQNVASFLVFDLQVGRYHPLHYSTTHHTSTIAHRPSLPPPSLTPYPLVGLARRCGSLRVHAPRLRRMLELGELDCCGGPHRRPRESFQHNQTGERGRRGLR